MNRIRCFLPTEGLPGSLYRVTVLLKDNCVPIRQDCLDAALDKWQRLFTVEVLDCQLCVMGVQMIVYVPNRRLTDGEAQGRNAEFDRWLRDGCGKGPKPRSHGFGPEKLASLSEFMKLFKLDLRRRHQGLPLPEGLPPGYSRKPEYRGRFGAAAVSHDALPPGFTEESLEAIGARLRKLGFPSSPAVCHPPELRTSAHGIGPLGFLADLEEKCHVYLASLGREPKLRVRIWEKYFTPISPETLDQRLKDLVRRETYEDYPKIWSLLQGLDEVTDRLLNSENIAIGYPLSAIGRQNLVLTCLPLSLTLLLTDGLIRWYYKSRKEVEFPHYNYYRRLYPWEVPGEAAV